jgi:hypothetical protein
MSCLADLYGCDPKEVLDKFLRMAYHEDLRQLGEDYLVFGYDAMCNEMARITLSGEEDEDGVGEALASFQEELSRRESRSEGASGHGRRHPRVATSCLT